MKDRLRFRLSYIAAALCLVLFIAAFLLLAYVQRVSETGTAIPSLTQVSDGDSRVRTYVFEFDKTPTEPVAVQFFSRETAVEIQFNSSTLGNPRSQKSSSFLLPTIKQNTSARIPKNYFLPGINRLDVFFEETTDKSDLGRVAIIGRERADTVFALQEDLSWWLPTVAIVAGMIAGLVSIAGLVLGQRRPEYVPLLAIGLIVLLVGVLSKGYSGPLVAIPRGLSSGLLILAHTGLLLFLGFSRGRFAAERGPIDAVALAIALFSICVSVWTLTFGPELFGALFSYSVSLVGSLLFILNRLLQLISLDVISFRRTLSELESVVTKQAIQLDEKSEVIAKEMIRNAILEERQRMMRDIHDGIGSQLLSLMLRVKSGKIGKRETSNGIKQSLTDLRLVVDSADHLGGDLAAAFATFRSRALQQLNAANIQMNWHLSEELLGQFKSTGKTLDVYRFMQEVVANIIGHSGAKAATFKVSLDHDQGRLLLEISDDGIGIPSGDERREGKGLRNLAKRAKLLGAGYSIGPGPGGVGTMVTLRLNHAQFPAANQSLIQPS